MMRTTITRTMATSEVRAYRLTMKEGKPEIETLPPVVMGGKVTKKEAEKELRKEYGKDAAITVSEIVVSEDVYEISVDDFMKHAKKVEKAKKETV